MYFESKDCPFMTKELNLFQDFIRFSAKANKMRFS